MESQDFSQTDLDSENFQTELYFKQLMQKSTIKEIYQKNYELQKNIRNYDQDIQSMVFENYSKFISSIDTVRQMKDGIETVKDQLTELQDSMNKMNGLTQTIVGALEVKHKEIQKLDLVNKDLQKMNNICEFPNIIKNDLQAYNSSNRESISHHFNRTVLVFRECFVNLQNLKEDPLIKPIYEEAIIYLDEMKSIFMGLLQEKNESQIKDLVKKFVIVVNDPSFIIKQYLKIIKEKFEQILQGKNEESIQAYLTLFTTEILFLTEELKQSIIDKQSQEYETSIIDFFQKQFEVLIQDKLKILDLKTQAEAALSSFFLPVMTTLETFQQNERAQNGPIRLLMQKISLTLEHILSQEIDRLFSGFNVFILQQILEIKKKCFKLDDQEPTYQINQIKQYQENFFSDLTQKSLYIYQSLKDILDHIQFEFKANLNQKIQRLQSDLNKYILFTSVLDRKEISIQSLGEFMSEKQITQVLPNFQGIIKIQSSLSYFMYQKIFLQDYPVYFNKLHQTISDFIPTSKPFNHQDEDLKIQKLNHNLMHNFCKFVSYQIKELVNIHIRLRFDNPKIYQKQIIQKLETFLEVIGGFWFQNSKKQHHPKQNFLLEFDKFEEDMSKMLAKKATHYDQVQLDQSTMILMVVKASLKYILASIRSQYFDEVQYLNFNQYIFGIIQFSHEITEDHEKQLITGFYLQIMDVAALQSLEQSPKPQDPQKLEEMYRLDQN